MWFLATTNSILCNFVEGNSNGFLSFWDWSLQDGESFKMKFFEQIWNTGRYSGREYRKYKKYGKYMGMEVA